MKWDKELRKRITGKHCTNKKDKINGVVLYSSTYLVQVRFENGSIKNYTYTQFLNDFEIIEEKKLPPINKKKERKTPLPQFDVYANRIITDYLEKKYPYDFIELRQWKGNIDKVFINDNFCGYLEITKSRVRISYFIRMPNPLLAKYQIKWSGKPKLNLNYEFTNLQDYEQKTDLYICLNELIFAHKQSEEEFIKETRKGGYDERQKNYC